MHVSMRLSPLLIDINDNLGLFREQSLIDRLAQDNLYRWKRRVRDRMCRKRQSIKVIATNKHGLAQRFAYSRNDLTFKLITKLAAASGRDFLLCSGALPRTSPGRGTVQSWQETSGEPLLDFSVLDQGIAIQSDEYPLQNQRMDLNDQDLYFSEALDVRALILECPSDALQSERRLWQAHSRLGLREAMRSHRD